jgi:hypothetical protein
VAHAIGAVFEIDNDLITAWRQYFDMSPYLEAQKAALAIGPGRGGGGAMTAEESMRAEVISAGQGRHLRF